MRRAAILTFCGLILCGLYGAAMVFLPWFDYREMARGFPYVAHRSGTVLVDDTGNPLRFARPQDADDYTRAYLCSGPETRDCPAGPSNERRQ